MRHIAIIMDGNRRFAKIHNKPLGFGHEAGAEVIKQVCQFVKNLGVLFLTLFAFSTENWSRKEEEISLLNSLLKKFLDSETKNFVENEIKVKIIGNIAPYSKQIQESIKILEESTSHFQNFTLSIALNYGGREDILQAVRSAISQGKEVDKEAFAELLYTKNLPDVDLLVRTGGAKRISNFLLWNLAYTELYFTDVLWPEFNEEEFKKAMEFFNSQTRNFGV